MANGSVAEEFPESFVRDAACALRAIDEISEAAPVLLDRPLDPHAQERMRRALEPGRIAAANESAARIIELPLPEGRWD